tara:strand:+ start:476 stop:1738 length:1263 start_codon:yes stop_codon:yes gene_type:complete
MKEIIKNIKGTKDILPNEVEIWQYVEDKIHLFFQKYGYHQIRTPKFENTSLFNRSIGLDTDIVNKEMYSWTDQGGNTLTLKPEVTASVVRSFIQHNLGKINSINKLYYIDSLFRRERPQKGRFRQFEQFGIEALGSNYPEIDAEVISMAYYLYDSFKIKSLKLKINSIGSKNTRLNYKKELKDYLINYKNDLSSISQNRLNSNPLRILDTKIDFEKEIIKDAPKIINYLDSDDKSHFDELLMLLDTMNIQYEIDHNLVRGLDYYTKTVFEIHSDILGSQAALCGGGRYDYLVEELGGDPTPAIGFAAGMERLILSLDDQKNDIFKKPFIYFITLGNGAIKASAKIINSLRIKQNLIVISNSLRKNLKAQMKEANKLNVSYVIILGDDEIKNNSAIIKDMDSGNQESVNLQKIEVFFKKLH